MKIEIPKECKKCVYRHFCEDTGFAKNKKECLGRLVPE